MIGTWGGAAVGLTFDGSGVKWVGRKASYLGIADVYVGNDVLVATVDQYSASPQYAQVVFEAGGLGTGSHTIRVVRKGTRTHRLSYPNISFDAFEVI